MSQMRRLSRVASETYVSHERERGAKGKAVTFKMRGTPTRNPLALRPSRRHDEAEEAEGEDPSKRDEHLAEARIRVSKVVGGEKVRQVILHRGLWSWALEELVALALYRGRARPPVGANLQLELPLLLVGERLWVFEG